MASEKQNQQNEQTFTRKVWITVGIVTLAVILLMLFRALFDLFLLVFAGVMIAIFFHGFAGIIQRYLHLPRKLSLVISVVFSLLLAVAFFWFVGNRLQDQISELSDSLPATIQNAKNQLNQTIIGKKLLDYLNASGNAQKTRDVITHFFSSGFGIVSDLYIVLLLGLFFTVEPSLYKKGIIHLLPTSAKAKGTELLEKTGTMLKKWLKGQIFGIICIAVLTAIGLLIMGMPLVLTLALIAGLLNFVPNFGPLIALIPAALIALMKSPSTAIIIVCMYTGVQIIQNSIEQPLIQKKMVNIPPALIIIGQIAMGALGGFWGVLFATPLIVIIMTVVNDLYVSKQL